MKSGGPNLLECSVPVRVCIRIALPLLTIMTSVNYVFRLPRHSVHLPIFSEGLLTKYLCLLYWPCHKYVAVTVRTGVFCHVTLQTTSCLPTFGASYCLHLQDNEVSFSEMLATRNHNTLCNILGNSFILSWILLSLCTSYITITLRVSVLLYVLLSSDIVRSMQITTTGLVRVKNGIDLVYVMHSLILPTKCTVSKTITRKCSGKNMKYCFTICCSS
jgi:hypothetical protein